jgi:hemolysin D
VKSLFVREGQRVQAGDVLLELDRTSTGAERSRVRNELQRLEEILARSRALLQKLDGNTAEPALQDLQNALVEQEWQQYRAQLAALQNQHENRKAEKQANREVIQKLRATLPINTQRAQNMQRLAEQKLVARDQYLLQEETRINQQQDLAAAVARDTQLAAAVLETEQTMAALTAQTRAKTLTVIAESERETESLRKQLMRASDIDDKQVLYAPMDGQVQDLTVHTVGGVVLEAQQLMVIVPEDAPLEVEAWLPNKDIGFVRQHAAAVVKINTFPFTKYGTLNATVTRIAEDAVQDEKTAREKGGLLYSMSLRMARNSIWVDGREEKLLPGMQVTAEIIIGQRRIIEYFLAPLQQHLQESVRER